MHLRPSFLLATALVLAIAGCTATGGGAPQSNADAADLARAVTMESLMKAIIDADYRGDRAELDRLYALAEPFTRDPAVASRAHYWRGFAKWRRAMNGANETPTPNDLAPDSVIAAEEMHRSAELDPEFHDAQIGEFATLGLTFFFDPTRAGDQALIERLRTVMTNLRATSSENPRYIWVWGMSYFNAPADRGGGPDKVIAAYHRALESIGAGAGSPKGPLDPAWGEAELHVNLAYSYLNKPNPDLPLARKHVDHAIRLQPTWHYARDILSPQIAAAGQSTKSAE